MFNRIREYFAQFDNGRVYPAIVHEKPVQSEKFVNWWKQHPEYKSRSKAEWEYMQAGNQYDFRTEK